MMICFTVSPRLWINASTSSMSSPGSITRASRVPSSPITEQLHCKGPTGRISWIMLYPGCPSLDKKKTSCHEGRSLTFFLLLGGCCGLLPRFNGLCLCRVSLHIRQHGSALPRTAHDHDRERDRGDHKNNRR